MGFLSWLDELFRSNEEYGTQSVTLTGQPVRSKAERVIADYFTHHGILYYYEAMATTNDWFIFKSKISRPDFYLPQYNLFVEYWGLVDSPDMGTRDNYIRTMRWKMVQYRKRSMSDMSSANSGYAVTHQMAYKQRCGPTLALLFCENLRASETGANIHRRPQYYRCPDMARVQRE